MFNGNGRIGSMAVAFILLLVAINVGRVRNEDRKPKLDVAIVLDGYTLGAIDDSDHRKANAKRAWYTNLAKHSSRSLENMVKSVLLIGEKVNVNATFAIFFRGTRGPIVVRVSFDETSKLKADAIVNKLRRVDRYYSVDSIDPNERGLGVFSVRQILVDDDAGKNREEAPDFIVWIGPLYGDNVGGGTTVDDHKAALERNVQNAKLAPDLAFAMDDIDQDPQHFWMIGNQIAYSKHDWNARDDVVANQIREILAHCNNDVLRDNCYFADAAQTCVNKDASREPDDANVAWSKYCSCETKECQRHCVGDHFEWVEAGECSETCGPGWQLFKIKYPTEFTRYCRQETHEKSCNLGECTTTTPTTQPPTTEPSNETSIQITNTTPKSKEEGMEVWMIVLIALGSTAALAVLILIPVCIVVGRKRRLRRAKAKPKQRPRVGDGGSRHRGRDRHEQQRGGRGESTMMGDSRIDDRRRDETARSDLRRDTSMTTDRRDRRPRSRSPPRTTQRSVVSTAGRSYDRNRRR